MDAAVCRAEVCYAFGRKHRRHRAVKRRDFVTLLGGAAAALPIATRAQQTDKVRRIGVLLPYRESDQEGPTNLATLRKGLHDLGWTDGRNIQIDDRWAAGDGE